MITSFDYLLTLNGFKPKRLGKLTQRQLLGSRCLRKSLVVLIRR